MTSNTGAQPRIPPVVCASLAEVRANIDLIDCQLITLLAERADFVKQAAAFKKDEDAVRAPNRVEAVIAKVRGKAQDAGLPPAVAEAVWRAMIEQFVQLELEEHRSSVLS